MWATKIAALIRRQHLFKVWHLLEEIRYYLKAIHSMNLGIKYWTISDTGCTTKSHSSNTTVRVGTTSTSPIWDQVFGRRSESIWFLFFLQWSSKVRMKCSISSRYWHKRYSFSGSFMTVTYSHISKHHFFFIVSLWTGVKTLG